MEFRPLRFSQIPAAMIAASLVVGGAAYPAVARAEEADELAAMVAVSEVDTGEQAMVSAEDDAIGGGDAASALPDGNDGYDAGPVDEVFGWSDDSDYAGEEGFASVLADGIGGDETIGGGEADIGVLDGGESGGEASSGDSSGAGEGGEEAGSDDESESGVGVGTEPADKPGGSESGGTDMLCANCAPDASDDGEAMQVMPPSSDDVGTDQGDAVVLSTGEGEGDDAEDPTDEELAQQLRDNQELARADYLLESENLQQYTLSQATPAYEASLQEMEENSAFTISLGGWKFLEILFHPDTIVPKLSTYLDVLKECADIAIFNTEALGLDELSEAAAIAQVNKGVLAEQLGYYSSALVDMLYLGGIKNPLASEEALEAKIKSFTSKLKGALEAHYESSEFEGSYLDLLKAVDERYDDPWMTEALVECTSPDLFATGSDGATIRDRLGSLKEGYDKGYSFLQQVARAQAICELGSGMSGALHALADACAEDEVSIPVLALRIAATDLAEQIERGDIYQLLVSEVCGSLDGMFSKFLKDKVKGAIKSLGQEYQVVAAEWTQVSNMYELGKMATNVWVGADTRFESYIKMNVLDTIQPKLALALFNAADTYRSERTVENASVVNSLGRLICGEYRVGYDLEKKYIDSIDQSALQLLLQNWFGAESAQAYLDGLSVRQQAVEDAFEFGCKMVDDLVANGSIVRHIDDEGYTAITLRSQDRFDNWSAAHKDVYQTCGMRSGLAASLNTHLVVHGDMMCGALQNNEGFTFEDGATLDVFGDLETSAFIMHDDDNLLRVRGDFYGGHWQGPESDMTAGRLELLGDYRLRWGGNSKDNRPQPRAEGTAVIAFVGTGEQVIGGHGGCDIGRVHIVNPNTRIEAGNKLTLQLAEDSWLADAPDRSIMTLDLNGYSLWVPGNLTTYYVAGLSSSQLWVAGNLSVIGNWGTFDARSSEITVGGSFGVLGDVCLADGSTLDVAGDMDLYGLHMSENQSALGESVCVGGDLKLSGIKMYHDDDIVKVYGTFYAGKTDGTESDMQAGRVELYGDLTMMWGGNFREWRPQPRAEGTCVIAFVGNGAQLVSGHLGCDLGRVHIANPNVTIAENTRISMRLAQDSALAQTSYRSLFMLDLGGHALVVSGDLWTDCIAGVENAALAVAGDMTVASNNTGFTAAGAQISVGGKLTVNNCVYLSGGSTLSVDGDVDVCGIRLSESQEDTGQTVTVLGEFRTAAIGMAHDDDRVVVYGHYYAGKTDGPQWTMTAGRLELYGDVTLLWGGNFRDAYPRPRAEGTAVIAFVGATEQVVDGVTKCDLGRIQFVNPNVRFADAAQYTATLGGNSVLNGTLADSISSMNLDVFSLDVLGDYSLPSIKGSVGSRLSVQGNLSNWRGIEASGMTIEVQGDYIGSFYEANVNLANASKMTVSGTCDNISKLMLSDSELSVGGGTTDTMVVRCPIYLREAARLSTTGSLMANDGIDVCDNARLVAGQLSTRSIVTHGYHSIIEVSGDLTTTGNCRVEIGELRVGGNVNEPQAGGGLTLAHAGVLVLTGDGAQTVGANTSFQIVNAQQIEGNVVYDQSKTPVYLWDPDNTEGMRYLQLADLEAFLSEDGMPAYLLSYGPGELAVELHEGTDYELVSVSDLVGSTRTVVLRGVGDYRGERRFECGLASDIPLTIATVADQQYRGVGIFPTPTVRSGSKVLSLHTDYELLYGSNVELGTGLITAVGQGEYLGARQILGFRIVARSIKNVTNTSPAWLSYTGETVVPSISLRNGDIDLIENVDYTVEYQGIQRVGTFIATVRGIGNYCNERSIGVVVSARRVGLLDTVVDEEESDSLPDGDDLNGSPTGVEGSGPLDAGTGIAASAGSGDDDSNGKPDGVAGSELLGTVLVDAADATAGIVMDVATLPDDEALLGAATSAETSAAALTAKTVVSDVPVLGVSCEEATTAIADADVASFVGAAADEVTVERDAKLAAKVIVAVPNVTDARVVAAVAPAADVSREDSGGTRSRSVAGLFAPLMFAFRRRRERIES